MSALALHVTFLVLAFASLGAAAFALSRDRHGIALPLVPAAMVFALCALWHM